MKIIEASGALTADMLSMLTSREATIARVKHFYRREACDAIVERMLSSDLYGRYANAPQIGRVGRAFFETTVSQQALTDYMEHSRQWLRDLRSACEPHQPPIDKLRCQLDECWDSGALLGRIRGKTMYAGLVRVFEQGAFAEPHQDHLDWDAAQHEIYSDAFYSVQLAGNVYLKMPRSGGQLAVWPVSLSKTEYDQRRLRGSYGINTNGLGEPVQLTPEEGELILFNARNVHRVDAPIGGSRVTASCFVGYKGNDHPLAVWS